MTTRRENVYIVKQRINRRAYELLADGEWRDLETVLMDLSRFTPPGEALRRAESISLAGRRKKGREDAPMRLTTEQAIRSGKRSNARESLLGGAAFEIDGEKVRCVGVPSVVRGDRRLAETARPMFDALASTFAGAKMGWAVEQVRQTAHEAGFHLTSCPEGCELLPLVKRDAGE